MADSNGFFTRFSIFLWCGVGFLFVSLRHMMVSGYNHPAGFMMLLGLAFLAAAVTDRKKRKLLAWREEQAQTLKKKK
jgi:hypothetical protein